VCVCVRATRRRLARQPAVAGEKFTFNNNSNNNNTRGRVYWSVLPGFYTS